MTAVTGPGTTDQQALARALLLGEPPIHDPYTGADLSAGEARPAFRAAELGLEAPRYCQLCGRRMVVQVAPMGWTARCSRHGTIDSGLLAR